MNPTLMTSEVTLPHDPGAEGTVLGAMLMSPDSCDEILAEVRAEDFYDRPNRVMFSAMARLSESATVEPVALADLLRSSGELESVGGMVRILDLSGNPLAVAGWRSSAEIIRRDRTYRDMILAASQIMRLASDAPGDSRPVIDEAESLLLSATEGIVRGNSSTLREMMGELYEDMVTRSESGEESGVRTGFPGLDRMTLGFRPGQMVVIGARPGVGKTSLCLNLATNVARHGTTVVMFSLEMSREEIAQRLLSTRSGIALTDIRSGRIAQGQWETVVDSITDLSELPMVVDDTSGTSVVEIRAKARRLLHGCRDAVVIVDYLQLMSGSGRGDSRATQVGEMSRGMKVMAKDLGVPVICLSQLNREVEGRQSKRPQLSDLRESGSIEQDADIVMLLDRSMTQEEAERKDRPDDGVTELIVAKNRSGPLGTVRLTFDGSTTRFLEVAERWS